MEDDLDLPKTQAALNLLWLLFAKPVPRTQWIAYTAKRLTHRKDDEIEAAAILTGQRDLDEATIERICDHFGVEPAHFKSAPLYGLGPGGVLLENIKHLLNDLPHGGKKKMAMLCDVTPATISHWIAGDQVPEKKNLRAMLVFFDLPIQTDLSATPLFLSRSPVGAFAQKRWLLNMVEQTPPAEVSKVFIAAKRIFRPHGPD